VIAAVAVPYEVKLGEGCVTYVISAGAAKGASIWHREGDKPPSEDFIQGRLLAITIEYEKKINGASEI